MNYRRPAFLSVVEKARHIMASEALDNNITARKPSKCSCGSVDPSYASRFDGCLTVVGSHYIISEWMTFILLLVVIPREEWSLHAIMQRIGVRWSLMLLVVVTWKVQVVLIQPESWCRRWDDVRLRNVRAMRNMSRSRKVNCIV